MENLVTKATILSLLVAGGLIAGTPLPQMESYALVTLFYAIALCACYFRGDLGVAYSPIVAAPVVVLWVLFAVEILLNPSARGALRAGAFIVFSGMNLFVVPGTFSREELLDAVSVVAAVVAGLTIPLAYLQTLTGDGVPGVWNVTYSLLGVSVTLPTLTSIFNNPNYLAFLSAVGLVAALGFARTPRRRVLATIFGLLCLVSLVLAGGRAAVLSVVAAGGIYVAYRIGGRIGVGATAVLGIGGAAVLFALITGLVWGVSLPGEIFNNRQALWIAAIAAIADQPLLGWGMMDTQSLLVDYGAPTPGNHLLGVHNSYLRLFLITGILGGVSYLLLLGGAVWRNVRALATVGFTTVVCLMLLVVSLTIQFFNGSTIFGVSFVSVWSALFVGYSQHATHRIEVPRGALRSGLGSVRRFGQRVLSN